MSTGATYSFQDVTCSIIGPGLALTLGSEAGAAEEGLDINPEGQKNTLTIGADGSWMHSLRAGNPGTVNVHLLKTSNQNALLMAAYNAQRVSSALWGKNVITLVQTDSEDTIVCAGAAFGNPPNLTYATQGGTVTWTFQVGKLNEILGQYS